MKISPLAFGLLLCALIEFSYETPVQSNAIEKSKTESYIQLVKEQIDKNIAPCDDFAKYACGNLKDREEVKMPCPRKKKLDTEIMDKILDVNGEPASATDRNALNLYLSCKNNKDPKAIFEQIDFIKTAGPWPTTREHTIKEIAILNAEIVKSDFIDIDRNEAEKAYVFEIGGKVDDVDAEKIAKRMIEHGSSEETAQIETKKIVEFFEKYNEIVEAIPEEEEMVDVENLEKLSELVPNFDWNSYFETVKKNYEYPEGNDYGLKVKDMNSIKKYVELLKNSDSKTIMNAMLYEVTTFAFDLNCVELMIFIRPIMLQKLMKKYVSKEDILSRLKILESFEKSMTEVAQKMKEVDTDMNIKKLRDFYENENEWLSEEILNKFYESFDFDPNALYKNLLQISRYVDKRVEDKVREWMTDGFQKIASADYSMIDFMGHDKPMLYYYITLNLKMWNIFFYSNDEMLYDSRETAETCLTQQHEYRENENLDYLIEYAVNKMNYMDYVKYLSESGDSTEMDDLKEVYFTALAQENCHHYNETTMEGSFFRVLRNMEEFSTTFKCSAESPMNKNADQDCKIADCRKNKLDLDIYAFKLPTCSE